jgi:hypothetical protein
MVLTRITALLRTILRGLQGTRYSPPTTESTSRRSSRSIALGRLHKPIEVMRTVPLVVPAPLRFKLRLGKSWIGAKSTPFWTCLPVTTAVAELRLLTQLPRFQN